MAEPLIDRMLRDARIIIADRSRRLRGMEAATAEGLDCDACADDAQRFCAVGALIRAAYISTGDRGHAHRRGWHVAGLIATAANVRRFDEDEPGWSLTALSDQRGQGVGVASLRCAHQAAAWQIPMCNLYSVTRNHDAILRLFRVSHNRAVPVGPQPAIFPGYQAPVVRQAPDGERELVDLNWGFVLLQKDRAPRRVTNVRDDKILTSKSGGRRLSSAVVWCRGRLTASLRARSRRPGIGSPSTARKSVRCSPSPACGRVIVVR